MKSAFTVSVDDYLTGVLQRVMYKNMEGKLVFVFSRAGGLLATMNMKFVIQKIVSIKSNNKGNVFSLTKGKVFPTKQKCVSFLSIHFV